jgi:hypothetical protein
MNENCEKQKDNSIFNGALGALMVSPDCIKKQPERELHLLLKATNFLVDEIIHSCIDDFEKPNANDLSKCKTRIWIGDLESVRRTKDVKTAARYDEKTFAIYILISLATLNLSSCNQVNKMMGDTSHL